MALAFTAQSQVNVTTNASTYTTGTAFTPQVGSLLVCIVCASSTDTVQTDPTSVSGGGVTYSELDSVFQSAVDTVGLWVGTTNSPSNGAVTASGWGTNRTGCNMTVVEVTGADMSGGAAGAIVASNIQKHSGVGSVVTATLPMNAPADSNNRAMGFFVHSVAEVVAADANNTLDSTGTYSTPNRGAGFVHNTSAFNDPGVTWATSASFRGIGFEIQVAAAAPAVPRKTAVFFASRARGVKPRPGNQPRFGWR